MNCTQRLFPPGLTHVIQPVDLHIGIQYKKAVYQAVRAESMKKIRENQGALTTRLKPLDKRVLVTKVVGETHERLARNGAFKRAFLATGTWLPNDHSADSQVDLQGVDMKYEDHITPGLIEEHRKKVEEVEAKAEAEKRAAIKVAEEKASAMAHRLSPAVERSSSI